jgi:hypothetical protein
VNTLDPVLMRFLRNRRSARLAFVYTTYDIYDSAEWPCATDAAVAHAEPSGLQAMSGSSSCARVHMLSYFRCRLVTLVPLYTCSASAALEHHSQHGTISAYAQMMTILFKTHLELNWAHIYTFAWR